MSVHFDASARATAPHLLLVEDDDVTRETCALILRDAGYDVSTAASGQEGLNRAFAVRYDLAVVDLLLGDMNAIAWLEQTRAAGLHLPVLVITGYPSIESAVQAMRQGAIHYAVKPLIGDDLLRTIELGLATAATAEPISPRSAHAAERWAKAILAVVDTRSDPKTIGQWARAAGASATSLRVWCRLAGVSSRNSLLFARLLRAVHQSRRTPWRPTQRLAVTDPRTLAKMLRAGGLPDSAGHVSMEQFLASQTLIDDKDALSAVERQLIPPSLT